MEDYELLKKLHIELGSLLARMPQETTKSGDVPSNKYVIRDPDSPATEPQRRKLKALGFKGSTSLMTKQEASDKIREIEDG